MIMMLKNNHDYRDVQSFLRKGKCYFWPKNFHRPKEEELQNIARVNWNIIKLSTDMKTKYQENHMISLPNKFLSNRA